MAIAATVTSGIRSIFCYNFGTVLKSWSPLEFESDLFASWKMDTFRTLASKAPFGPNGHVQLGFSTDLWFLPKEVIAPMLDEVKKLGVRTVTTHVVHNPQFGLKCDSPSTVRLIDSRGVLDETILISHGSGLPPADAALAKNRGAHFSCTPSTELQMSMGLPICYQEEMKEIHSHCGLGIDCHSNNGASIVNEMRIGLQAGRNSRNEKYLAKDTAPRYVEPKVQYAFNLGTIQSARVARMEDKIGSLVVGKLADIVIFDATSPAMVCAAEQDPVAAVVLHSSPADIDTVIVDGVTRKSGGKLLSVKVDEEAKPVVKQDVLEWKDVSRELLRSRSEIQKRIEPLDLDAARKSLMKVYGVDGNAIVEAI